MKLFSQKGKPIETAPPGNDGSKLPIVRSLTPGVVPLDEVPAALDALSDDLAKRLGGIPIDLPGGRGVAPVRYSGTSPNSRLDLSQYRVQAPNPNLVQCRTRADRLVQFEKGETLIIEGCKFKIVYVRSNPSRMTLEAV